MKHKSDKVRLKDVAKETSYSLSTVAKVLAGSAKESRISDAAASEILAVADRLGYVPNLMARNLRSKKSGMIGIHLTMPNDSIATSILTSILQELPSKGYMPLLTIEDTGYETCYKAWLRNRVEGLLFCGPSPHMTHENFSRLEEHAIPFVIAGNPYTSFNSNINMSSMAIVQINNRMGIQLTIGHLTATGRKRIAFIGGPPMQSDAVERKGAYTELIREYHAPIIADIGGEELFWQRGYLSAKELFANDPDIDAIISYDDNVALGAMKYLSDNTIRIPEDIAVTGFDNQPFSGYSIPSLTTIHQPTDQIGKEGVNILNKLITKNDVPCNHVYIEPSLVVRTSTSH